MLRPEEKLKSAEPEGFQYPQQPERVDGKQHTRAEMEEHQRQSLGLTPDSEGLSEQADQIAAYNAERQAKIDQLTSLPEPAEDPDEIDLGRPWASLTGRDRDAIIKPPLPDIPATEPVLEAARERDSEAGG